MGQRLPRGAIILGGEPFPQDDLWFAEGITSTPGAGLDYSRAVRVSVSGTKLLRRRKEGDQFESFRGICSEGGGRAQTCCATPAGDTLVGWRGAICASQPCSGRQRSRIDYFMARF